MPLKWRIFHTFQFLMPLPCTHTIVRIMNDFPFSEEEPFSKFPQLSTVLPASNMPLPASNMALPASNMALPASNMALPASNMPLPASNMPPPTPSNRMSLTIQQRQLLIAEYERRKLNGQNCSQNALSEWATDSFKLTKPLSQPSVSKILKRRQSILSCSANPNARRATPPRCIRLEKTLLNWVTYCLVKDLPLTGALICEKAKLLLDGINERSTADRIEMSFSNGWLSNFKQRYNMKRWKAIRKESDISKPAGQHSCKADIAKRVQNYRLEDIFCVGEFGLKYCLSPDTTIALRQNDEDRKHDFRITCLLCTNATGREKRPLRIVGRAKDPKSFNAKSGEDLGFDYVWNENACMTPDLFYTWLTQFDTHVGRQCNRKVCLLMDISVAHGNEDSLPKLTNTEVLFLQPSYTSNLNPLGAGIITRLKHLYRIQHMELALDMKEAGIVNVYDISQLNAMYSLREEWSKMDELFIAACWKIIGFLRDLDKVSGLNEYILPRTLLEGRSALESTIDKLIPVSQRMSVDYLLTHPHEATENDPFIEGDMLNDILYDGRTESCEPPQAFPNAQEQLKAISMAKLVLQNSSELSPDALKILKAAQTTLRIAVKNGN